VNEECLVDVLTEEFRCEWLIGSLNDEEEEWLQECQRVYKVLAGQEP